MKTLAVTTSDGPNWIETSSNWLLVDVTPRSFKGRHHRFRSSLGRGRTHHMVPRTPRLRRASGRRCAATRGGRVFEKVHVMCSSSSQATIQRLRQSLATHHGIPEILVSDCS